MGKTLTIHPRTNRKDIGMSFGEDKCGRRVSKRGKVSTAEGTEEATLQMSRAATLSFELQKSKWRMEERAKLEDIQIQTDKQVMLTNWTLWW